MAEAEPQAGAKKKSSFMAMLIEWLLVTLIAGGAGAALHAMNPPPPPDKPADAAMAKKAEKAAKSETKGGGHGGHETKEEPKAEVAAADCGPGPSLVDLPPIVTNLANPSDTWVRLEAAIVFDPKALLHPDVIAAQIATDELAYLRTISVAELQGPIGLENIRQDLRDRAMVRSNGKIIDLLLKTLVLQ
jgi:flagellar FliL protein